MLIEIPQFDCTGNVVEYINTSVDLPCCVKKSNWLYDQYRMIDEKACFEITKFNNGSIQLHKIEHTKANEPVTEQSKLIGFRFWRFGFQNKEFTPCPLAEMLAINEVSSSIFLEISTKYFV